jgi:hypothetical protein
MVFTGAFDRVLAGGLCGAGAAGAAPKGTPWISDATPGWTAGCPKLGITEEISSLENSLISVAILLSR